MKIFPLFQIEHWPLYLQMAPALIIGFFFGFTLERAGFGNARVLAAQFYLYNMRVFKVMFTAIVTAGVGMAALGAAGVLDMRLLSWPETFLWPHLVGGLLLGAGFIISGYCPGTSIVAAASGKLDGFVTIFGVVIGSWIFGELYPVLKGFYLSGARGVMTLHDLLHVPYAGLMAAVAGAAALMFVGAEKVEKIFGARMKDEDRPVVTYARRPVYAVVGAGLVAVFLYAVVPASSESRPEKTIGVLTPVELGQRIVENPKALTIADLRKKPDCEGKDRIPGALCFEDLKADLALLSPDRDLVIYGWKSLKKAPAEAQAFPGRVFRLKGGLAYWKSSIMENPEKRAGAVIEREGRDAYSLVISLHAYFTGARAAAAPAAPVKVIKRPQKKGGGGCI